MAFQAPELLAPPPPESGAVLVVELGSQYVRAGFAGEEAPRVVIPAAARWNAPAGRHICGWAGLADLEGGEVHRVFSNPAEGLCAAGGGGGGLGAEREVVLALFDQVTTRFPIAPSLRSPPPVECELRSHSLRGRICLTAVCSVAVGL